MTDSRSDGASDALKALREGLRGSVADVESLIDLVTTCLERLRRSQATGDLEEVQRAIQRYLPSVQLHLISETLPAFLHTLEDTQLDEIRRLFVPFPHAENEHARLKVARWIALTSYLTLPSLLNANTTTPLPPNVRTWLLDVLARLSNMYGIDEMYWAVWGSEAAVENRGEGGQGKRMLQWEEVTKNMVALPAKCANSAGRWASDGWTGEVPEQLEAGPYFDALIIRLERLMYETSISERDHSERIRIVIHRLASIGLMSSSAASSSSSSRQPSFTPSLLPGLLAHLHPPRHTGLSPYPASVLPSIFLPLPPSTLASFVPGLLAHLPIRLDSANLSPSQPSADVHRMIEIMTAVIGPAIPGEEAWMATLRCFSGRTTYDDPQSALEHYRARTMIGWIRRGGLGAAKTFLDHVVNMWTDTNSIKFSLFSQQFHLTHLLLLSLSLLPPYHPYLVAISHRGEFLLAVQSFLGHPDPKIRRLGMLVAEIVSSLTIRVDGDDNHAGRGDEDEIEELKAGLDAEEPGASSRIPKAPKRLKFDNSMWDGEGQGKEECRWLRQCVGVDDLQAEIGDDTTGEAWMLGWTGPSKNPASAPRVPTPQAKRGRDSEPKAKLTTKHQPKPKVVMLDADQAADPLQGYTPDSPSSSRSPSPTPSYLDEVAADPTLALDTSQEKKITRPVYVPQLIALLKEREKPEHIEMGLKWGEGLVRAKRTFGTELSENAVNVALVTLALNDPYHLDDFDEKRQGLLNALVACAPKQVAPFLSEQYFNGQYSLQQKSVLLTSLAMGARELAGLSVPQPISTTRRLDFPTKTLPPALHQKYIGPNDMTPGGAFKGQLEDAIGGVRDLMLSKSAKRGEETVPELAREKRLKVGGAAKAKVAEVGSLAERQMTAAQQQRQPPVVPFSDVAAEYFIMPLINRFWQHYQDSTIRESRARGTGDRYRGAGTGLVLAPMALEKLLMTLSLLLHAARHSPAFLSILAPEALELGVTIGSRHLPSPSNDPFLDGNDTANEGPKAEAQVLSAALELVLVALDISVDLDQGRTLAMDKPELVLATGEWATGVFEVENKGGKVSSGQGGMREGRVRATAAGVVVKIAEIGEKWVSLGRAMR